MQKLLLARKVVGAVHSDANIESWAEAQGAEQTAGVAARDLHVAFERRREVANAQQRDVILCQQGRVRGGWHGVDYGVLRGHLLALGCAGEHALHIVFLRPKLQLIPAATA